MLGCWSGSVLRWSSSNLHGAAPRTAPIKEDAIEALGIVGGDSVNATLVEIYHGTDSENIREAALEGMLISGHDEGVIEIYRSSTDPAEKRELLELLVVMGSDDVWDVIDSALEGNP